MHYTEGLPKEFFAYFVKSHLDEDKDKKPIWSSRKQLGQTPSVGSPTIKSVNQGVQDKSEDKTTLQHEIALSSDTSFLTRFQAIELEPFLREEIAHQQEKQMRGKFLQDGYMRLIQKNIQEEKLKDSIENEVDALNSVLDEMQSLTGREIFDDLKQLNLKKGSNALNKDLSSTRKFRSQRTFSDRTIKLVQENIRKASINEADRTALTQLRTPDRFSGKDESPLIGTDLRLGALKQNSTGAEDHMNSESIEINQQS